METCAATFPDLKSSLLPPLADWRKRHATVQEKSDALHANLSRHRHPGMGNDGLPVMLEGRLNGADYHPAQRHPEAYELVKNSSMR